MDISRTLPSDVSGDLLAEVLSYKSLYEALSRLVQDAVIQLDAAAKIVRWNLAAEALTGYSAQRSIGSALRDLLADGELKKILEISADGAAHETRFTFVDPAGARKLLTEAGYPDGFGLTIHGSNNRFPNDSQLTQALGQMFSRGGLKVNAVEVMPYNVYAPSATQRKFSVFHFSYGSIGSSSLNGLSGVLATFDAAAGTGSLNRSRYSNKDFDKILAQAAAEFDQTKRDKLLAAATRIAMEDAAILPLYWQKLFWAARKGYAVDPDRGEATSARFVHLAK